MHMPMPVVHITGTGAHDGDSGTACCGNTRQHGVEQREDFKIPPKVWDVELTRQQRADLQSGKAVLVEGIKGYDGKTISQYVKANFNQGRLDFYNENPDRKRDASQRNVVANSQRQEQGNRKSKGASIA